MSFELLPFPHTAAASGETPRDVAGALLGGDEGTMAQVSRWISEILVSPRFWRLRAELLDLHQEAMLGILDSLRARRFDPSRDFRAYVRGVTRNTAMYALRRHAKRRALAFFMRLTPTALDPREAMGTVILVRRLLDLATPQCRNLIRGYFLKEHDYEELARDGQVPVGTIKSRLSRCLEKAHRLLEGAGK